ncbi:signal peptidase I [Catenulispora yoronensis]|uniref:signal peptidase I n=1 Tax=Catenulispora yoronensis TaxID=450799 RepID=UPI0031DD7593
MDESSETAETAGRGEGMVPRPDQAAHDQSGTFGEPGRSGRSGRSENGESWNGARGSSVSADSEDASGSSDTSGSFDSSDFSDSSGSSGSSDEPVVGPPRPPAPRAWWQWLYAPFVAVWRFAFPKKPRPFIVELPFLLAIALVLAFVIKTFLVQAFVIPSGSMQQTLEINDRVLVNRFSNWMGHEPNRGDIVVFQDPGGWLESEPVKPKNLVSKTLTAIGLLPEDNGDLIKRVIGVGGDHVESKGNGQPVTVNGVPLKEDGYLYPSNLPSMEPFSVDVPKDHIWVMGDHREVSVDSRAHIKGPTGGFVPVGNVVGIAVLKVWPPDHFGTLPVPSTFKQSFQALAAPGAVPATAVALAIPVTIVRRRRKLRKLEALDALGL